MSSWYFSCSSSSCYRDGCREGSAALFEPCDFSDAADVSTTFRARFEQPDRGSKASLPARFARQQHDRKKIPVGKQSTVIRTCIIVLSIRILLSRWTWLYSAFVVKTLTAAVASRQEDVEPGCGLGGMFMQSEELHLGAAVHWDGASSLRSGSWPTLNLAIRAACITGRGTGR